MKMAQSGQEAKTICQEKQHLWNENLILYPRLYMYSFFFPFVNIGEKGVWVKAKKKLKNLTRFSTLMKANKLGNYLFWDVWMIFYNSKNFHLVILLSTLYFWTLHFWRFFLCFLRFFEKYQSQNFHALSLSQNRESQNWFWYFLSELEQSQNWFSSKSRKKWKSQNFHGMFLCQVRESQNWFLLSFCKSLKSQNFHDNILDDS